MSVTTPESFSKSSPVYFQDDAGNYIYGFCEDESGQALYRQVQESVYMEDTIRRLLELGVDTVIEIGPGRALTGFVGKTVGEAIACYPVEDCASLEAAVAAVRA